MAAGRSAPRYQMMALLYPRSDNLQSCLHEYFIVVVRLCHQLLKFTLKSTLGQYVSSLSNLDTMYQSQLDFWANAIKEEVSLVMAKTTEEEAKENSKFRILSSKLSESMSYREKLKTTLRVLNSCSLYDYETTWKQTRRIGNTTLFNRIAEYQEWKGQETSCTLICTGKLGSGKSVLLANLVDDLNLDSRSKDIIVAYFFCRYDIPESLKAQIVIGSLARQLLCSIADLTIVRGFVDKTTALALDFEKISSLLQLALPSQFKAYFVLDGLNECDSREREILITQLQSLQRIFSLLLCVSIRLDPDNILNLSREQFTAARIISIPDDNPDIEAFISAELESCIESKKLVIGNPVLIVKIHDALLEGSQGMFLWVALQIESLCDMKTDEAIRQALVDLPKDLPETFFRILQKSEGSGKGYQRQILELIIVAHRPLTAEELREAMSVVPGDTDWNPSRLLNDIYLILPCCGSLITIDEEEKTIRFVHHSVKQFLLERFKDSANIAITISGANKTMANIIVTYLNYGIFETQLSTMVVPRITTASAPSQIIRSTLNSSSSVRNIALKLLKSRKQPDFDMGKTLAETSNLFNSRSMDEFHFYSYAKLYWQQHIIYISEPEPVMYDLLLKLFQGNAVNINATYGDSQTALSWAAASGHEAVVKLLLDKGAELESKTGEGWTPLWWAAVTGHEVVVKLLLDKGAELESRDGYGRTPLWWAAASGHEAVVKLLLDKGAELESKDKDGRTPLRRAAANGHEAVVKLLLDKGAELESKDGDGQTPLC
jgi:hypothetical protein